MHEDIIYLDYAATHPFKAPGVQEAFLQGLEIASPGRGGHQAGLEASRAIYDTRHAIAESFSLKDERKVIFCSGATAALNTVLFGLLSHKDNAKVISTDLEHNAVARPLHQLKITQGLEWKTLSAHDGHFSERLQQELQHQVDLVIVNHISNVTGRRQDIDAIQKLCLETSTPLCIDAAQSVGIEDLDINPLSCIAAGGHKGLQGPQGIGLLVLGENFPTLNPTIFGGTGSHSEHLEPPSAYPDFLEVGTPNTPGILGLHAAFKFCTPEERQNRRTLLQDKRQRLYTLLQGLSPDLCLYGPLNGGSALAFEIEKVDSQACAHFLDHEYKIAVRAGLHCAPLAHQSLKTFPNGLIRVSLSHDTDQQHIDIFIGALRHFLDENC